MITRESTCRSRAGLPEEVQALAPIFRAELQAYQEQRKPPYELLRGLDPGEVEQVKQYLKQALPLEATPSTIVTDGAGRVLSVQLGVASVSRIRQLLDELRTRSRGS